MTKPSMPFTVCASSSQRPNAPAHQWPMAAIAALRTSETISRKAIPRIRPKDTSRARIRLKSPLYSGRRGVPDPIERVLQLAEHGGGAGQHQGRPDDRPGHPVRLLVQVRQRLLDGGRRRRSHHVAELAEDLTADRVGPEEQAGHRDHDQQGRCQREHRVIGERRAHARGVIGEPGGDGLLDQHPPLRERGHVHPARWGPNLARRLRIMSKNLAHALKPSPSAKRRFAARACGIRRPGNLRFW